jgi:hypothetical protein
MLVCLLHIFDVIILEKIEIESEKKSRKQVFPFVFGKRRGALKIEF